MTSQSIALPAAPSRTSAVGIDDDPKRDFRTSLVILAAFGGLFVGWAKFAPLDAAANAVGRIAVSGHNQVVAHREGGVIAEVDVAEGQHVRAGQVLLRLAPEDVGAQARALSAEVISLEAQKARLSAEIESRPAIAWPADFAALTGDDLAAAKAAQQVQQAQFEADRDAWSAQSAASASKTRELQEQIAGGQGQLNSNLQEHVLLDQELTGVRSLAARGFASQNSVRSLERNAAELEGAQDQLAANVAGARQAIAENQFVLTNQRKQNAETWAASLRQTEDELGLDLPKLEAARGALARWTLRAQADGVVTGLTVFAPGSVAAPGQALMEIVPDRPTLIVEARIAANDIAGVRVGQKAQIRLLTLGARGAPVLTGALTDVSADSLTDEKTNQTYYTAKVAVSQDQLARLQKDEGGAVRPGLPVQVMIPLRPRSAFDYLFEPLTQSLWKDFRQR